MYFPYILDQEPIWLVYVDLHISFKFLRRLCMQLPASLWFILPTVAGNDSALFVFKFSNPDSDTFNSYFCNFVCGLENTSFKKSLKDKNSL